MTDLPSFQRVRPIVDEDGRLTVAGWQEFERLRAVILELQQALADHDARIEALEP